ncbi:MAG: hypothetical protein HRU41_24780 [Saprospiraceae bacterium]|nr:hypothetical protein [Saprospiraceae bacterium]
MKIIVSILLSCTFVFAKAQCDELANKNKRLIAKVSELETEVSRLSPFELPNKLAKVSQGHDLSRVQWRFVLDESLPVGKIKVNAENRIILSPKDWQIINPNTRKLFLERLENPNRPIKTREDLSRYLEEQLGTTIKEERVRVMEEVLPAAQRGTKNKLEKDYLLIEKGEQDCSKIINDISDYIDNNPGKEVQIALKGMTEAELNAIKRSVEIKKVKAKLSSVKSEQPGKIPSKDYEFSLVREEEINTYNNRNQEQLSDVEVKISSKGNSNSQLRITIKGVTKKVVDTIKDILMKLFKRAQTEDFDFAKTLRKELKDANIDVRELELQLEDCIICQSPFFKKLWYENVESDRQTIELLVGHRFADD